MTARWWWRLVACMLVATVPALAYVPSVDLLFRKAAARVSEGGRSRGDVALMGTLQSSDGSAQRTLLLRFPLSCRFEGGAQVRGTAMQPLPSSSASTPEQELLELACPLIAYRGLRNAEAEVALRTTAGITGVDLNTRTTLDRLNDRVVEVIGATPRQLDRPQLWLYKDSHAPARLIAKRDGHVEDLRLLEYGNPAAAEWFPRILELYRDGKASLRFEVLESKGFRPAAPEEQEDERE
ncbi:MAG TPA: hypothetical protein VG496_01185 [Myxococcales bacterium]|nr:hypothetical protein [Myxococcales bacterium]